LALVLAFAGSALADDAAETDAAALAATEASPTPEAIGGDVPVIDRAEAISPVGNHYKCYPVLSSTVFTPRRVKLRDQFVDVPAWVLRPRYLCNPVEKTTEDGIVYPIVDPERHLVCYEIREDVPTGDWKVATRDQFGYLELKGNKAELLCLPAYKEIISPPPPAPAPTFP
jgi:hypothetical protein